jgi:hypothetical protein
MGRMGSMGKMGSITQPAYVGLWNDRYPMEGNLERWPLNLEP